MSGRWPDTTTADKPENSSPWGYSQWLVGRHPVLQRLLARVPDVVTWEGGEPWVELENLKGAINAYDAYCAAWEAYRKRTWEPQDEARWEQWDAAGPKHDDSFGVAPGVVYSIAVMSRTEQSRLRLLATVGSGGVLFSINDVSGFDEEGQRFIADWCSLVLAQ